MVVLASPILTLPFCAFSKSPRVILRVPVLSVITSCISSILAAPTSKLPAIVKVSSAFKSEIVTFFTFAEIEMASSPSPEVTVAPSAVILIWSSPAPALIESAPPEVIVSLAAVALTTQSLVPVEIFCA